MEHWVGHITYQSIFCSLYLDRQENGSSLLSLSIPEMELWNIPHFYIENHKEAIKFFWWDNPLIGTCYFRKYEEKAILSFINISCISENEVVMKKEADFFTNHENIVCGKFLEKEDYIQKLKEANFLENREKKDSIFKYHYIWEHEEYEKLRSFLHIKSFQKRRSTFELAVDLMRIIHKLTVAPGMTVYIPPQRSGYSLLTKKLRGEIGLNCRGTAIILNDVLLSAGIQSKFIVCMSQDVYDPECHVTNSVFIPEWKKWVLLDSALQTYIVDEHKIPLNIPEIRNRIINKKVLNFMTAPDILNTRLNEANFERYLSKNMYCFLSYETYGPYCDNRENENKKFLLISKKNNGLYHKIFENSSVFITDDYESFFE